ncbi:hypothetical protein F0P96_15770 [Hymenobacter busanensis]|uniref:Uncharacterized protein n=1 Tax=Hymenobacter busanensis TaxID=2607656 RepID=A0A7L4ZVI5_9BACT|nr:hypothetical protein [Hymenobacter busanensis]KAA9327441.1 hypothetical protein F0P96_15770 [Hymenobacter busanensis]QHJ06222.1 hypothetical protein GUY19_02470 [Hymenobacter busanensis]
MRPELERLHRIEQYLLSTSAATDWQRQLRLDPTLADDAHEQLRLYQALHEAGRLQLRRELSRIHTRLYGPRRTGWFTAATAGLRTVLLRWPRFRSRS